MREEEAADDDSYEEAWAHKESWGSSSGGSWSRGRGHADSGSGWVRCAASPLARARYLTPAGACFPASPGGSAYGRSPPHRCVTLRARADSLGGVEEAELQLALALSLSLSQNEVAPPATAEVAHSPGGSSGGGSLGRPPRPPARPAPAPPPPHPGSYLRHAAAELSYERLCELEDVRPVAPEEAVAALPTLSWGEQGAEAEGGCCSICQMDYEEGEMLMLLPCAHRMHAPCAREWLLKWSKRCPEWCGSTPAAPRAIG